MKRLLVISALFMSACAQAHPALSELRPLGSNDALTSSESAEEVFAGEQWAVYQINKSGQCSGYALANVDTKYFMRIDVRGEDACQADTVIQLAALPKAGEYQLTVGDTVTELASQ